MKKMQCADFLVILHLWRNLFSSKLAAQWTHIIPNGASRSLSPDGKCDSINILHEEVAYENKSSYRQYAAS